MGLSRDTSGALLAVAIAYAAVSPQATPAGVVELMLLLMSAHYHFASKLALSKDP